MQWKIRDIYIHFNTTWKVLLFRGKFGEKLLTLRDSNQTLSKSIKFRLLPLCRKHFPFRFINILCFPIKNYTFLPVYTEIAAPCYGMLLCVGSCWTASGVAHVLYIFLPSFSVIPFGPKNNVHINLSFFIHRFCGKRSKFVCTTSWASMQASE